MSTMGNVQYSEGNHPIFCIRGMLYIFMNLNSLFRRYFTYLKLV